METQAAQPLSGYPSATYPRWVVLEFHCARKNKQDPTSVDTTTLAIARSSTGHPIQVSLLVAAPPATSRICVQLAAGFYVGHSTVVAAHGDSVLIEIGHADNRITDHFVYNAGAAAAKPPRPLSLLPAYFLAEEERDKFSRPLHRCLELFATGLVRRGEDEIVVAELTTVAASEDEPKKKLAELFMLRSGVWSISYPLISGISRRDDRRGRQDLPSLWKSDIVVPVGDRLLCWVDLCIGLVFCDVFEERPRLQYVPLPEDESFIELKNRNMCVTAGGNTVKFVNILPHCCDHCHNAYTIKTWALNTDDMVWVMDSMVDSTELQAAFDSYEDLPRVPLSYPVVNMDEPHVISFQLCESYHVKCGDQTLWLVTVDMTSKTVQSVSQCPGGQHLFGRSSRVSYYLNSCQSKSSDDTSNGGRQADIEPPPMVIDDELLRDNADSTLLQSSSNSSVGPALQASEMLDALEEIPSHGLARADQLRTYSILSHDNGRGSERFYGSR